MTISKLSQLERDYTRVTKTRPWLIPATWQAPHVYEPLPGTSGADQLEAVEECSKLINARLRRAYQQRRRRARARAVQIAAQRHGTSSEHGLPSRGWRSRELQGNRQAPSSTETLRRRSMNRAHLLADPAWELKEDEYGRPYYGKSWGSGFEEPE
jgi:hypothetical protein